MVSSAVYMKIDEQDELKDLVFGSYIFLALILLIALYSLPIVFYRYVIRRRSVNRRKAKIIALSYALCFFVIVFLLVQTPEAISILGGIIFLWGWVNYRMLIHGLDKELLAKMPMSQEEYRPGSRVTDSQEHDPGAIVSDEATSARQLPLEVEGETRSQPRTGGSMGNGESGLLYCHICGNRLVVGSKFCNRCGTAIPAAKDTGIKEEK